MRLSLRTLLAFEDNVFDTEQHRQLERIIPKHDAAAMMLGRIRRVVRHPRLGVPGRVDQREELDPNAVAEYLDHQMSDDTQQRFEAFCLSSDKYLAETASVHQILSNVLGEPARTSRECRLRCYNLYGTEPNVPSLREQTFEEKLNHLAENITMTRKPPESAPDHEPEAGFDAFLRLYPSSSPQEPSPIREPENFAVPTSSISPAISFPASTSDVRRSRGDDRPVVETVAGEKNDADADSWIIRLCRCFSTKEKPDHTVVEKSERKGFSLWLLLFVFLLGFGLLFGWKKIEEKSSKRPTHRASQEVRNEAAFPLIPPAPPEPAPEKPAPTPPPAKPDTSVVAPPAPKKTPEASVPDVAPPKPKPEAAAKKKPPVKPPVKAVEKAEKALETAAKQTALPTPTLPKSAEAKEPPAAKPEPKKTEEIKEVAEKTKTPTEPIHTPPPSPLPALPVVSKTEKTEEKTEEKKAEKVTKTPLTPPVQTVQNPPVDPFLSAAVEPLPTGETVESVKTVGWSVQETASEKTKEKKTAAASLFTNSSFQTTPLAPSEPAPLLERVANASETPLESPSSPSFEAQTPASVSITQPVDPLEKESIIAFQPIVAPPQRRSVEPVAQELPPAAPPPRPVFTEVTPETRRPRPQKSKESDDPAAPEMAFREVVHPVAVARQFGEVVPASQVLEQGRKVVGRALPMPEPGFVFSAPSAGEQWTLKTLPQELYVDQYLLSVTPFRINLDLGGSFHVEMVGDAKICILPPDENGVPGIFVDYGRLVIRPIPTSDADVGRSLRIRTEHVSGSLEMTGPNSVAFVDTFAEVMSEAGTDTSNRVPKASPIIGFLPAASELIRWQTEGRGKPLVTDRMASILLKPENAGFGSIQGRPNWLERLPLPAEGRQLAEVCTRIFTEHNGNSEAALHALILQESTHVRFFGYRLWGDLGRFDVPLSLMAEANPQEEPIRQVLVPYFREVMKRDEETVQRLADAIEAVRR